jgi:GNAT superfamily N-acetyltransferase
VVDGKLIAFIGAWTRPALLKGQPVTIADGSDICVHPDYQGRGVMGALISSGEEGRRSDACYIEGSSHPAVIRGRAAVPEARGEFGDRIERFVAPLTLRSAAGTFRLQPGRSPRKLARSAGRILAWLWRRGRRTAVGAPDISVREVEAFDERTDVLWHEASRQFDFVMVRDQAYLSWRYADKRAGDFTILHAEDEKGARLLGYAVYCTDRTGARGYVADLLVVPDRLDVAAALTRDALARLRRAGAEDAELWLPERHPYRAVLEDAGFVLRRRKEVTAYRVTSARFETQLACLSEPDVALHFTLGDMDRV